MTFCLGVKVQEGLVGIADTLVTSGIEGITARKVSIYQNGNHSMFLMTSGLRSVRDKALTYFDEVMDEKGDTFDRLFKAVNALSDAIRRVAKEDARALKGSGLRFDINCLVGGQMEHDKEHKLYLVYPQGNWVEIGEATPYQIVGVGGYGKPILDRTLKYTDSMKFALKVGMLSFDSTRISATDVDFPVDVILYREGTYKIIEHRFQKSDLAYVSDWWQENLRQSVGNLPSDWVDVALNKLP
ncbi:MAG: peptidase [Tepidiformaceae bacterium]